MKILKIALGVLVSIFFVVILVNNLEWDKIWKDLDNNNYFIILPAIIIQLSSYWIRSVRWKYILSSMKLMKSSELFPIVAISYMANNILPFRMGEFVRAYLVGKKSGISKTSSFSTIVLEKIYDGISLLFILGITAFIFPFPSWVRNMGLISTLVFLGALIFAICLVIFRSGTIKVVDRFLKYTPNTVYNSINKLLDRLIEGFEVVKDRKNLIPIAFYSMLIWLMEATLFFAIAESFGFSDTIFIALFVLVIVNLGIMIPSSPGYVGTFEYFVIKSLNVFNITKETAMGYALVLRFAQYLPITLIGFIFMVKEGLSLKGLARLHKEESKQ
ncbi:flippase-like domain-containing protein [Paenibacillus dendritiformis]|uniref:lysylphosphatidylglycerol synthase transmembrane domain-containing protein n=1 Tax=Paenibacillus dendritiformis TaxID=130049 RepID=UPI00105AA26F|nr:lysylphosphatidylglycerol synthase transmembrane domain-containing protein [Paenibacillus dendritiformis]TDL51866.1 flippase-like domain-containing protein [Paenibacillus dendritiformis]